MVQDQFLTFGRACSGALIVKNVKSEDDGVYICTAEHLLGSVNASVKLTVQCEFCEYVYKQRIDINALVKLSEEWRFER